MLCARIIQPVLMVTHVANYQTYRMDVARSRLQFVVATKFIVALKEQRVILKQDLANLGIL